MTVTNRVSRRAVLTRSAVTLSGAAAFAALPSAAAEEKISQADARYRDKPNGAQHCEACLNFRSPNGCAFVQGEIKPDGWCELFDPKS